MSTQHVLAAVLALLASGCAPGTVEPGGPQCTALFAYGLTVTVTDDAPPGDRICDARVSAIEGDYLEPLQPQGDGADCVYIGAGERAGTYRVEATKDGFSTAARDDVVVTADECHVQGTALELSITALD